MYHHRRESIQNTSVMPPTVAILIEIYEIDITMVHPTCAQSDEIPNMAVRSYELSIYLVL